MRTVPSTYEKTWYSHAGGAETGGLLGLSGQLIYLNPHALGSVRDLVTKTKRESQGDGSGQT